MCSTRANLLAKEVDQARKQLEKSKEASRADPRIFACVVPKYAQKMFWLKNNNLHLYTSV